MGLFLEGADNRKPVIRQGKTVLFELAGGSRRKAGLFGCAGYGSFYRIVKIPPGENPDNKYPRFLLACRTLGRNCRAGIDVPHEGQGQGSVTEIRHGGFKGKERGIDGSLFRRQGSNPVERRGCGADCRLAQGRDLAGPVLSIYRGCQNASVVGVLLGKKWQVNLLRTGMQKGKRDRFCAKKGLRARHLAGARSRKNSSIPRGGGGALRSPALSRQRTALTGDIPALFLRGGRRASIGV